MNRIELRQVLRESKAINKDVLNEGVLKNVGLGALALVAGAGLLFAKGVINFAKTGDVFKGEDRGFGSSDKGIFSIISTLFANKMKNSKSKDVRAISEKMRQMRLALSKNPEDDLPGVVDTILEFSVGDEKIDEVAKKVNKDTLNQLKVYNIWNTRANEIMKKKDAVEENISKQYHKHEEEKQSNNVSESKKTTNTKRDGLKADSDLLRFLVDIKSKESITPKMILDYDAMGGFTRKLSTDEKEILRSYGDKRVNLKMDDIREVWEICKKIINKQYEDFRKDYVNLIDQVGEMDANKAKNLLDDLRNVDKDLYNEMSKSVDAMVKDKEEEKRKEGEASQKTEREKQNACVLAAVLILGHSVLGDLSNEEEWVNRAKKILTNAGVSRVDNDLLVKLYNYDGLQGIQNGTSKALAWFRDVITTPEKIDTKSFERNLYDYKSNDEDARSFLNRIRGHIQQKNSTLDETVFRKILDDAMKHEWETEEDGKTKKESYSVYALKRMFYNIKSLNESVTRMKSAD